MTRTFMPDLPYRSCSLSEIFKVGKEADRGSASAAFNYAAYLDKCYGGDRDPKCIAERYREAAALGENRALINLLGLYCSHELDQNDQELQSILSKLENCNNGDFYFKVYLFLNTLKRVKQASRWLNKAVALQFPDAQWTMAYRYITGTGIKKDYAKGLKLTEIAANAGSVDARGFLAASYLHGWMVPVNYQKGLEIINQADLSTRPLIRYAIGQHCLLDKIEPELAFNHYIEAANEGLPQAQNAVGCLYVAAVGTHRSWALANTFFKMAVAQGDICAMYNLGVLMGRLGNSKEEAEEGIRLLTICVEKHKHQDAAFALSIILECGRPFIQEDIEKSEMYYQLVNCSWLRKPTESIYGNRIVVDSETRNIIMADMGCYYCNYKQYDKKRDKKAKPHTIRVGFAIENQIQS